MITPRPTIGRSNSKSGTSDTACGTWRIDCPASVGSGWTEWLTVARSWKSGERQGVNSIAQPNYRKLGGMTPNRVIFLRDSSINALLKAILHDTVARSALFSRICASYSGRDLYSSQPPMHRLYRVCRHGATSSLAVANLLGGIMGRKLYVGNLPISADSTLLEKKFGQCGSVESTKIITDPSTYSNGTRASSSD